MTARDASGRFVKKPSPAPRVGPQLALNRARIPGGLGCDRPAEAIDLGTTWLPTDADPWASPIGLALAMEHAQRRTAHEGEAA